MELIEQIITMLEQGTAVPLSPAQALDALKIFQKIQQRGVLGHLGDELDKHSEQSIFEMAGLIDPTSQDLVSTVVSMIQDLKRTESSESAGISPELLG